MDVCLKERSNLLQSNNVKLAGVGFTANQSDQSHTIASCIRGLGCRMILIILLLNGFSLCSWLGINILALSLRSLR